MVRQTNPHPAIQSTAIGLLVSACLAGTAAGDAVLLNNGSVVEGRVRRDGEAVVVKVPSGGELRLREADVAVVRPTRVALYEWLRSDRTPAAGSARFHLDLAEWCLRNSLWPQASRELLEARSLDPDSDRAALLERRLILLSSPPDATNRATVDRREPVGPAGERVANAVAEPRLIMPPGGLEHFAQRIQPVLVNSCTAGGCHRSGEAGAFVLDRRLLHGYGDARSTQNNLRAALLAIDADSPSESPLLVAARGPHQGATPLRGPRRAELLERLERWAGSVAAAQPAVALTPPPIVDAAVRMASHVEPVAPTAPQSAEPPVLPSDRRIERDGLIRMVEPVDEFDAEVFNRRHRRAQDDLPLPAGSS